MNLIFKWRGGKGGAFVPSAVAAHNFSPQSSLSGGQKTATKFLVSCFGTRARENYGHESEIHLPCRAGFRRFTLKSGAKGTHDEKERVAERVAERSELRRAEGRRDLWRLKTAGTL